MIILEQFSDTVETDYRNPPLLPQLLARIERDFMPRWQDWGGKCLLHGERPGSDAVRLDGNDYLGLTGHPDIVRAQIDALRTDAEAVVQSGVFQLGAHPARALGTALANWIGKEDGYLCQSGFAANVGLLQSIASENTPVYLDGLAHASLWEGAHTARAPAHAFRHNDPAHLARTIASHGPGIVIVDAVYSTTGALCPLLDMLEVVERHGCMIVVDESHSLGTHGPRGAGLCAQLGVADRVHFVTASLAKAFAGRAGFFTIPTWMYYYMLSSNYANIFSSGLLLHEVAGLAATYEAILRSDTARDRLHANTRRLRASLSAMGYPIHQGTEQIIALEAGTEPAAQFLRDQLERQGIFGAVFCAPATTRNRAMVRLTLNAGLTASELDHIEAAAHAIAPIVKPWEWPIARRMRVKSGS